VRDDERVLDAAQRLHVIEIRRRGARADRRRFRERGEQHARDALIDAEQRLSAHELRVVDSGDTRAEQAEVLLRLQRDARGVGHRQRRGDFGELAVGRAAVAGRMAHRARLRRQLGRRHVPVLRSRGDEHRARRRAGLAQRVVIHRDRQRAAGELRAVLGRIDDRLAHFDVLPIGVELFGDDHRQRRLDALADVGILRVQHDLPVGLDLHVRIRVERRAAARLRLRLRLPRALRQRDREHEPAACEARELDETAAAQARGFLGALRVQLLHERRQIDAHRAPPFFAIFAAALWIALRIRVYVPQRQRFAAMSRSMSSSVGFGFWASNAVARIICPAWQ
jgi:hypothetical protein